MRLTAGTRLGPYELVAPLGAGGIGDVYRARDTRLRREVALKVLPPDVASDAGRRARFEQEAQAAAALNHPNILGIHDVGTDSGVFYIATELVTGETLAAVIERGLSEPAPLAGRHARCRRGVRAGPGPLDLGFRARRAHAITFGPDEETRGIWTPDDIVFVSGAGGERGLYSKLASGAGAVIALGSLAFSTAPVELHHEGQPANLADCPSLVPTDAVCPRCTSPSGSFPKSGGCAQDRLASSPTPCRSCPDIARSFRNEATCGLAARSRVAALAASGAVGAGIGRPGGPDLAGHRTAVESVLYQESS